MLFRLSYFSDFSKSRKASANLYEIVYLSPEESIMKKICLIFLTFLLLSCSTEDNSGSTEDNPDSESLWDFEFISNMPCDHYQYYTMRDTDEGGTIRNEVNYHFQRNDTIMSYNYSTTERNREGDIVLYGSGAASGGYTVMTAVNEKGK